MSTLILSGDENIPDLPMAESEVNHLRRMLAWMRVEYMLDDDMQRGYVSGLSACVRMGEITGGHASDLLMEKADEIKRVPAYVRQAVRMLTKAIREHERASGVVESVAGITHSATP